MSRLRVTFLATTLIILVCGMARAENCSEFNLNPNNFAQVDYRINNVGRTKMSSTKSSSRKGAPSSLAPQDLKKVMDWIAAKVAAERFPFCYKESQTRGVKPLSLSCPAGTEKNGLLCYPKCKPGYSGNGPTCWQACPQGFQDIGAFCQKPEAYGRGAGYVLWEKDKCNNEHSQGCEQNGALFYPKCGPGFQSAGANICSPICPNGLKDTGTGCTKGSYGRGVGETLACPSGYNKENLLCYPACADGSDGVGPVCWKQCPNLHPVSCGTACADKVGNCVKATKDMVVSVLSAAANLASMGSGAGSVASKASTIFERTTQAMSLATGEVDSIENIKGLLDIATSAFANDFAEMTTDEVNSQIDEKFSAETATEIKKEWAKRQFYLMASVNASAAAKNILGLVSELDPTGIGGVVNAFSHPICDKSIEFPEVAELK